MSSRFHARETARTVSSVPHPHVPLPDHTTTLTRCAPCTVPVCLFGGVDLNNIYLIPFLIVIMSGGVFAVPMENIGERLALSATVFLVLVAYKFTIHEMIPNVPYYTQLDQYLTSATSPLSPSASYLASTLLGRPGSRCLSSSGSISSTATPTHTGRRTSGGGASWQPLSSPTSISMSRCASMPFVRSLLPSCLVSSLVLKRTGGGRNNGCTRSKRSVLHPSGPSMKLSRRCWPMEAYTSMKTARSRIPLATTPSCAMCQPSKWSTGNQTQRFPGHQRHQLRRRPRQTVLTHSRSPSSAWSA